MELDPVWIADRVRAALAEDLGAAGDLTTQATVPAGRRGQARILARRAGVLCGLPVALEVLRQADEQILVSEARAEGQRVAPGDVLLAFSGPAPGILAAERTLLNFLQRLSGIATLTSQFVAAVRGTGVRILDTRKTTPGLRPLEKYAVRIGGGDNHRAGLHDQILIKENHFAMAAPRPYADVVAAAVAASRAVPVIAEARDLEEALAAVQGGARVVLLDNFAPGAALREVVAAVRGAARELGRDVEIEASGGIRLDNARAFADCGVDRLSVGELTHSPRALDLSLLLDPMP